MQNRRIMTGTQRKTTRPETGANPAPNRPRSGSVYLRPLKRTDADAFVAAVALSRVLHRPWVYPPASRAAFERRIKRIAHEPKSSVALVALRSDDDALIGSFNISEIIRGPLQQAFLGYYAFAPHAGRGYMREAMPLLLRYAFRRLKLHRIEANIQPTNQPSLALARSAGFVREGFSERYLKVGGRWRDHERWAINADQWKASQARRS